VRVSLFDADFTLVRRSTVRQFIARALAEGLVGPSIAFYAPLLSLRYAFGGPGSLGATGPLPFLRGVGASDLESFAQRLFEERLRPRIDAVVASRVEAALRRGERVAIASASFGFILAPLAKALGVDDIVANELEYEDGAATGRLAGPPVIGEGKLARVLEYLEGGGHAPAQCAFYSDSAGDLPLLREVGRPVAVNPRRRLRREALASGWEVLDTRSGREE
jgi:HAD superfamily hydrolase (TIGR01490 family)